MKMMSSTTILTAVTAAISAQLTIEAPPERETETHSTSQHSTHAYQNSDNIFISARTSGAIVV